MNMRFSGGLAAVLAVSLSPIAAHATELMFTVTYGLLHPGVTETFEVNTSAAGMSSAESAAYYGASQDEDFTISNDSLGNKLLMVGDGSDNYYFATGISDFIAFNAPPTFTGSTTEQFYDGSSPYLQAYAGETAYGFDGTVISVSDVPEPGAWAMMLLGLGFAGASLRSPRRKSAART